MIANLRVITALGWLLMATAAPLATRADDAASGWVATRSIAAPEAIQAAAADDEHLYAISNSVVAKYDRATGERIAVSAGDAEHLNSGFLWRGRLYCAHSNYPQTPPRSEVRVLDPHSMRLATEHTFSDVDGSLTWVIRDEAGRWWANFAHYGQDNGRTFLAQLDDAWRERRRWAYPPELIKQLGDYSLSGGIWQDGALVVTGHDARRLYRLRVPSSGDTLELVGVHPAPFTGQGIAADPETGGLVGIDRAARELVLASRRAPAAESSSRAEPLRLRVLSYNIHHAEGVDGRLDLPRIARTISAVEPDLVALQEVERRTERTGRVDQPAELGRMTGMHAVFGGNIDFRGGRYGNAVLSRYEIVRHENHLLPNRDDGEQRGVLQVEIKLPGLDQPLILLATHLDHRRDDRERRESAEAINRLIGEHPDRPALLAGDLNDTPESPSLKRFAERWTRAGEAVLPTVPVADPARQIDFVLYRPEDRWRVVDVRVLDEQVASDHRAILAELELLPAESDSP